MKGAAPITVRSDRYGCWEADCDNSCASPLHLCATFWNEAYETALGHACLHHRSAS